MEYNNVISDAKSISKAIGLKPSRTRDYLKQFVDERFRDFVIASPKSFHQIAFRWVYAVS